MTIIRDIIDAGAAMPLELRFDSVVVNRQAMINTLYDDTAARANITDKTFMGFPLVISDHVTGWAIMADCPDCTLSLDFTKAPTVCNTAMKETIRNGRRLYVCAKCEGHRMIPVAHSDDWKDER